MPRKQKQPELRQANLSPLEMEKAILKIDRRIVDLEAFSVDSVDERSDPRIGALSKQLDTLLVNIFGADTVEYKRYKWDVTHLDRASMSYMSKTPISEVREGLRSGIAKATMQLETIKSGFLEEIEDTAGKVSATMPSRLGAVGNNIFIVHGHDDSIKQDVARFLEKLGLNPIVLHEQPNKGRTIIEKFEDHSNVRFAVVLLTPDDVGRTKAPSSLGVPPQHDRARQNVILELGYFIGTLGRNRVCALYHEGVELPSDLSGILYVKLDKGDSWKLSLAREIKAAGIDVDLNKVF